jgi:hypothetical protein
MFQCYCHCYRECTVFMTPRKQSTSDSAPHLLLLVSSFPDSWLLKMTMICSSGTSVDFGRTTRRYIAEDKTLQSSPARENSGDLHTQGCWLEVSVCIREVLRLTISAQVRVVFLYLQANAEMVPKSQVAIACVSCSPPGVCSSE